MASIPLKARPAFEPTRRVDAGRAQIATDRIDELETPMAMADVIGAPPAETALPSAGLLSRRGVFEPLVVAASMRAVPIGDYRAVFAAFTRMSALGEVPAAGIARIGERQGNSIARLVRTTTPKWYDNWTAAAPAPERPPPVFPVRRRGQD